jgi:hypothetical protein
MWVTAEEATDFETGNDDRPATVRFNMVPAVIASDG